MAGVVWGARWWFDRGGGGWVDREGFWVGGSDVIH